MADLEERSAAPLVLIVGMLGTKDADGFLRNFPGLAREVIAVPITGQIAARPAEEVAAHRRGGRPHDVGAAGRRSGARLAPRNVWDRPPRVLICGSLYLAGEVLAANGTLPQGLGHSGTR